MTANALGVDLDPAKVVDVDILSDDFRQNWRSYFADWAGREPFYSLSNGVPYLILASYADNVEVLHGSQDGRFATSWGTGAEVFEWFPGFPIIINLEGAEHKRVRTAMQPAFAAHGVGVHLEFIEATVERLLDEIEAKAGEFDAVADFGRKVISTVLLEGMLGTRPEHVEPFTALSYLLPSVGENRGHTPEFRRAFDDVIAVADEMLADERYKDNDDFVGRLVRACHDGSISREEFVGGIMAICTGGLSSTAGATAMMLYHRCRYRDQFDDVRREPELIKAAVEECLRVHPAGISIQPRFAAVESEIGGTTVYPGMPILPCPPLANFDPARFENPLEFDIRRNPKHVAFGKGMHICIGLVVARTILQISLDHFLERFPNLRLVDPDFTPTYRGVVGELHPVEMPMRFN